MSTNPEFDLKTFQSEVLVSFTSLQMSSAFAGVDVRDLDKKVDLSFSLLGLFTRALIAGFRWLGRRGERNVKGERDFEKKNAKATKIAGNPKIKELLCPRLKAEILPDLPTEAARTRIVSIVTGSLLDGKVAEEFSIERDVRLFSLIILRIWQKGIGGYCTPLGDNAIHISS